VPVSLQAQEGDSVPDHLHRYKYWRSVIEIIAQDQISAFVNHPYFLMLITDKWKKFAMHCHLLYRCVPYIFCIVLYITVAIMVQAEIRSSPDQSLEFSREGCSGGHFYFSSGSLQFIFLIVAEIILYFCCTVWLTSQGMHFLNVSLSDLDPEQDMKISLSNIRFFMFNNLEPLLDIASATTLFVAGVSRFSCNGMVEMGAQSIAGILLFCNFLNSLLPFQHLAAMIITLFNMLFGDVTAFLIVFGVVLSGFSFAVDFLTTTGSQESGAFTRLIYVALGDGISGVADLAETSLLPGQVRSILMVWVVLCNILLLNFLIAMMGDTFNKRKDTYEIWIFPFAKKVLLYEKNLYKRKSYDMRCIQNPTQAAYRFGQR
jgi:hypothetical protein